MSRSGADGELSGLRIRLDPRDPFSEPHAAQRIEALKALAPTALTSLEVHGIPKWAMPTYLALAQRQRRLTRPALLGARD